MYFDKGVILISESSLPEVEETADTT